MIEFCAEVIHDEGDRVLAWVRISDRTRVRAEFIKSSYPGVPCRPGDEFRYLPTVGDVPGTILPMDFDMTDIQKEIDQLDSEYKPVEVMP
ncbi:hypothetical protein LCGC14_1028240 [marine sediment metagenome]|uniref:Uncharacterized protein n=1 Tax=marine sediment metagenome TaxID=412755 RepID=A0A0F9NH79_9ZZZZ